MEERPLYGIVIAGSVYMESYTTTFNILYSSDGYSFSYIKDINTDTAKVRFERDISEYR